MSQSVEQIIMGDIPWTPRSEVRAMVVAVLVLPLLRKHKAQKKAQMKSARDQKLKAAIARSNEREQARIRAHHASLMKLTADMTPSEFEAWMAHEVPC